MKDLPKLSHRHALDEDVAEVAALITRLEGAIDPAAGVTSRDTALGIIRGLLDRHYATLFYAGAELVALSNQNPDELRRAVFLDVYAPPEVVDQVVAWSLEQSRVEFPDWSIVPGVNVRDAALIEAFRSRGLEVLRRYWIMRCDTATAVSPEPPPGVSMLALDIEVDEDLRLWHATHMDAFSEHFGFVPRPFESFRDLVLNEPGLDRQGVFLAMRDGRPLGYLESSDELIDDGYGFISRLGVVKAARGQGIGELLLRHGIAHAAAKGYSKVELSVDAGNESGALRLYEKVGFQVAMSWLQLSNNPDFGRVGEPG